MITTNTTSQIANLDGTYSQVPTRMDYTSFDPYAVHFQFTATNGQVDWSFDRALLIEGMAAGDRWAGEGDVLITRLDDELAVLLRSPNGEVVFLFDLTEVSRFVGRTLLEMPLGDELMSETQLFGGVHFAE